MKQFKRLLCLMMALLMIFLTFVACGEDPAEPAKNSDTTVADGTGTTAPSTNETTAPTENETTAPTGNETTTPTGNETNPPVTEPPETNPPETVPPCEVHTFETGKLCTEEKVCTVCGEIEPAGEHSYSDLPCTVERKCITCGDALAAAADHVLSEPAACGTRKCQNCTYASFDGTGRCVRDDWTLPCIYCGYPSPDFIPYVSIAGISIKDFTIVIPTYEKNKGYDYEYHIGAMIRHKVNQLNRVDTKIPMVSDTAEKSGPEIRIGKTNRTVTECAADEYIIRVVGNDLEIVCGEMYAFDGLLTKLDDLLRPGETGIIIEKGQDITEKFTPLATDTLDGDIRIMFHNIYQYENARAIDIRTRYGFYKKLYSHYMPDVIGMQEASASYWTADKGLSIRQYLRDLGYKEINAGNSQLIWYNSNTVELMDKTSYGTNSRNNWAIFRQKGEGNEGNIFGVISIHLRANSVAEDAAEANQFRVEDAKKVNLSKADMIAYAKQAGVEDADNLPIFAGGDYNCRIDADPITQVIMQQGNGLYNIRDVIQDKTKVDDYVASYTAPKWNQTFDYQVLTPYAALEGTGKNSIDHLYVYAEGVHYTANQYRVIRSLTSRGCADHAPHYVDISFK